MAARIVRVPPQLGQCSISISNTRLSSLAQLMRADAEGWRVSPWPGALSTTLAGAFGMIWGTGLGIGSEHAMEANEMQPRTGNQRSQALHELKPCRNQSRLAIVEHPSTNAECRVKNRKRPQRMRKNTGYHKGHEH